MTPRELARLYETLVRDAPDAIVYADQEGVIRFWNRGTERTFGFSAAEAIGKSLDPVIPERLRGRHWEGYRRVMETGVTRTAPGISSPFRLCARGASRFRSSSRSCRFATRRAACAESPRSCVT